MVKVSAFRRLATTGTAFVALSLAGTVSASAGPEVPARRVVLVPGRDFRLNPESLFVDGDVSSRPLDSSGSADIEAASSAALVALDGEPEIRRVPFPTEIPADPESGAPELVIRGMLHLGIERYRDIRLPEAIRVLEEAVSVSLNSYVDVFLPGLVSDLYLYLGLCRLETGEPDMAHVALKNSFLLAPERRFRSGWFPAQVEKALRAAALDFIQSPPAENPLGTTARLSGFLKRIKADVVYYMYLDRGTDGPPRLETRVFELSRTEQDSVAVTRDSRRWEGPESASMAVSVWLACTDLPSRVDTVRRMPRLFLDTGFSYSMFLADNTTRKGFHNLGLALDLAYQVQPGLDTFIRVNLYKSLEDVYGDLLDDFWSLRTSIGVGYSTVFSWGRFFTHFGFEMNYLSGFRSSTDPACKLWPDDPDLCATSNVSKPSFLFGATGMAGLNVFLSRSVFMTFQAGLSGYFVTNEKLMDLNFPFVTEIGFGYAFF